MSTRKDNDAPETTDRPRADVERWPGSYYYDDQTGYEVYNPAEDDDADETERENEEAEPLKPE
jgi:hypothetical protein